MPEEPRRSAPGDSLLETVSEVDWQPERDAAARVGRSTLAQIVLVGSALLVCVLSVERVPGWMLQRASERASVCIDRARDQGKEPARCHPGAWVAVPRWVPHTRAEALERGAEIEASIASVQLAHATGRRPDREARNAAARVLAGRPGRARALHDAGAFEIASGLDVGDARLEGGHWPALAALSVGDVNAARARIMQGTFDHHRGVVHAGALACLLGERERGRELLARADEVWRGEVDPRGSAEARLAVGHCGGTLEDVGFEPRRVPLPWRIEVELVRAYDPSFQAGRRGAFGRDLVTTPWLSRAGVLGASVLAATDEVGPVELLAIAMGDDRLGQWNAADILSPHLVLAPGRYDYVPPTWIESAATRFESAVSEVPDPITVEDLKRLPLVYGTYRLPDDPRGTLREAAFVLWRVAAVFRARAGDREGAASALARAAAIESPRRLALAPIQLAIGDARGALASLDAWAAAHGTAAGAGEHAIASFNRALASMSLGDPAAAYEAAREAVEQGAKAEALDAYRDGFEWVLAATAIASGRIDEPLALHDPNPDFPYVSPGSWIEAIRAGTPTDALRQRFFDERATRAGLVAEVFVVEHAGALVGDPEVAADAFFAAMHPSRALARARAEAARWQGDETRASRWDARADAIEALMTDDHRVALAGLAEVW